MKVLFLLLISAASSLKLENQYNGEYDSPYVVGEFESRKRELIHSRDNVE